MAVFAHNGDLKNFTPALDGPYRAVGTTDSELAFCYLLQQLRNQFGETLPPLAELTQALRELTHYIAGHGSFNMLMSDGSALFSHCSTDLYYLIRQHPFASAHLSDQDVSVDFSEVTTSKDRVVVIVTQPLTTNETWTHFRQGELKVFVEGAVVE